MTTALTPIGTFSDNAGATMSPSSLSDVQGCAHVFFPSIKDDENDADPSQMSFVEACQLAAETNRPLHLTQDILDLSETIVLRKRQHLSIVGRPQSLASFDSSEGVASSKKIQIAGKIHSLFLLNNQSQLRLRDLELVHQETDDEDCRKVGAAVNLRYKSKAWLEHCSVISHAGFCCWAVQKAGIDLDKCTLEAPLRSAVVCFGQAKFEGRSCTIANVGVHGVCARGECQIRLIDSSIVDSAVRGLYAYANASVCLNGCTIKGTARPDMAAVEVSSAEVTTTPASNSETKGKTGKKKTVVQKASSLIMKDCCVIENAGVGVRIRGGVRHNLSIENGEQNRVARNLGGNIMYLSSTSAGDATGDGSNGEKGDEANQKRCEKQNSNGHSHTTGSDRNGDVSMNQSNQQFRRDASGSSFRKGDWWCLECVPKSIVQGSKDSCPRCSSGKSDGQFLSSEEVVKLNRNGFYTAAPTIAPSSSTTIVSNSIQSRQTEHEATASLRKESPTWWFDGDDAGWLPYDTESNHKLESVFQSLCSRQFNSPGSKGEEMVDEEMDKQTPSSKIVFLSDGRYRVNLETMEQINTESHFLRLVQRREN